MRYMRPLTVSTDIPRPREELYDYLDVLANHEQFTDHMMRNWRLSGPPRGVGAKVTVDAVLGGRSEPVDVEVIEAEAPCRNVERNTGAGGKRVGTGSYTLESLPGGHTRVTFEYAWQTAPLSERLAAPIIRIFMRRALEQAMARLGEELTARA